MDNWCKPVTPHPQFLDLLFTFRSKVFSVYREIMGIHEISHIAVNYITNDQKLICLSSTPSIEFNLFSSPLWHFDRSYHPQWYLKKETALWQDLYHPERFDELYYLKQIKPRLSFGVTIGAEHQGRSLILSMATSKSCETTRELFEHKHDDFQKIGLYCFNQLKPLFNPYDHAQENALATTGAL